MATNLRQILPDPGAVALRASELFVMAASSAISARGSFSVAFSGGTTPELFFRTLSGEPFREGVDWENVHVFFVDERCVEPTDSMSNFRLANDALLDSVPANTHRIEGDLGAEEAATRYSVELREVLGEAPVFDMIFLGMGADGHTASLFPGASAIDERELSAVPVTDHEPPRVSLTLPVINSARTILFIVTGEQKAAPLREILEEGNPGGLPAGKVNGKALWLLDKAAASELGDKG